MNKLFMVLSLTAFTATFAEASCEKKIAVLEKKIEVAKQYDNANKVKGLEEALENTKANCTEEKLQEKKAKKIEKQKEDVKEAKKDLEQAKQENKKAEKIKKKQRKLKKAEKELKEAQEAE